MTHPLRVCIQSCCFMFPCYDLASGAESSAEVLKTVRELYYF